MHIYNNKGDFVIKRPFNEGEDIMVNICCEDMSDHLYLIDKKTVLKNGDKSGKPIYYSSKFNEYGIPIADEISYIIIEYCPWCGKKLPESLREKWFHELEILGFAEPLFHDNYPDKYKSSLWWEKNRY